MSNKTCETFATPVEMCTTDAKYLVSVTNITGVTSQPHAICEEHFERYISDKLGRYVAAHVALVNNHG